MSFLSNTKINEADDFDDLDEEVNMDNVPKVSEEQIKEAEIIDKEVKKDLGQTPTVDFTPATPEERRAMLKKKLAEKRRAARNGNNRNLNKSQPLMANMKQMMDTPEMKQMMDVMLQGDNLQKILKEIPPEKLGINMPGFNPSQMKKIMQNMKPKN